MRKFSGAGARVEPVGSQPGWLADPARPAPVRRPPARGGRQETASARAARPDQRWKDKTAELYAAAQLLEKGEAGAVAKYKDAVNCKACHSVHKPE